MSTSRALILTLALAVVGLPVWGFLIEPASLRNENYELAIPNWPRECDGLRVAVLADLHVGSPFNGPGKLDREVALTQRASPDLILLAGDFVIHGVPGGEFTDPEEIALGLKDLSAPLGVWAVLGNHDWWFDGPRVRAALESVGIRFLEDASAHVASEACSFWLVGLSDFWEGRHDVAGAFSQVPPEAPVLVFTHNPDVFPEIPPRASLTIAGHTHGGQVYIPFIGRPVVPSRYGERFAIGHIVEDGRHLFVNSGLGTSIIPVRFLVPPEVSVLTVRSAISGSPANKALQQTRRYSGRWPAW